MDQDREAALQLEIDALRQDIKDGREEITKLAAQRDQAQAGQRLTEKLMERMIDGLALTASPYEAALLDDYDWADQVAGHASAGYGMDSIRANRQLMALVSGKQQVTIIEADTSGLQGQLNSLSAQRDAMQQRLDEMQMERNTIRASLVTVVDERDTALSERDGLSHRIEQLSTRAALLIDERDAALQLAEDRLEEILRQSEMAQGLNAELTGTAEAFNTAEAARVSLVADTLALSAQLEAEVGARQSVEAERDAARSAHAALQTEHDEALADRRLLLEEVARLDSTVETVLDKNVTLQTLIDTVLSEAEADRGRAAEAAADRAALTEQLSDAQGSLATALDQRDSALANLAAAREQLSERKAIVAEHEDALADLGDENRSLMTFVDALEADLNAREVALRASEDALASQGEALGNLTKEAKANQAFFDLVVGQCMVLMGQEGGADTIDDRQALAYECAAAFESARRWRADLTEMVDLRDRSLQACEARQAALEAQACSPGTGD